MPDTVTTDAMPRCAIVIPTYNGAALTSTCLNALLANPPTSCRWSIIVVDDGSVDSTPEALAPFEPDITLLQQSKNTGFARACNAGARAAGDCDFLVFLNNDTLPLAGWLDALVEAIQADERVAAVGAKLLFPGGLVQHAGVAIGQDGWPHHLYAGFDGEHPAVNRAKQVPAVTAACMLIRREDFDALGGFDSAFHNGYEDMDLCLRLGQRGRLIRYCPKSVLYHLESVTRWPTSVPESTEVNDRLYQQRWHDSVARDDVRHYLDDGLLAFGYGPHYPVTMTVSPDLAVIQRDGEDLTAVERLLSERARQVMELISANTRAELQVDTPLRRQIGRPGGPPGGGSTLQSTTSAKRVSDGRVHNLGGASSAHLVSVVLPVKNCARYLDQLLPAVLQQSAPARLEIIAVDSGSTDGTVDVLRRSDATVLTIDPAAFDHGLTRNLGAAEAQGDILVFLTHHSRPVDDRWLAPLIAALDDDPELAAACSRIRPRPDADVLTRRDVERDYSASPARQRKQITDWAAYRALTPDERRRFLNFHTVGAAIRAEAWQATPFRSMRAVGEDLLWARETVEAGWALLHEPASMVYHSHSYTLDQLLGRNVDDGIANRDIVGRELAKDEVVTMIETLVKDDWSYLREAGLSGEELERWQLEAALRRGAQIIGQWIGLNHDSLPEEMIGELSSIARIRARARETR